MFPPSFALPRQARSLCAKIRDFSVRANEKTKNQPYPLPRFAAGRDAVFSRRARHSCHATSIGEATAIDE